MKLIFTHRAYYYRVHTHILKLYIKQIHGYVGLLDDDWSILILCRRLICESLVKLLWLFPHEGGSEVTRICVAGSRNMIQMEYI